MQSKKELESQKPQPRPEGPQGQSPGMNVPISEASVFEALGRRTAAADALEKALNQTVQQLNATRKQLVEAKQEIAELKTQLDNAQKVIKKKHKSPAAEETKKESKEEVGSDGSQEQG